MLQCLRTKSISLIASCCSSLMQKIMASPEVIDGGTRPEDMYSPSKYAQGCRQSTECPVCMHAHGPVAHTHMNTITINAQQIFFKQCLHLFFSWSVMHVHFRQSVFSCCCEYRTKTLHEFTTDLSVWLYLTSIGRSFLTLSSVCLCSWFPRHRQISLWGSTFLSF